MKLTKTEIFGRLNESGNVDILHTETGEAVTRIDVSGIYPVGSELSTQYEHSNGIVLTVDDAEKLGIEIER